MEEVDAIVIGAGQGGDPLARALAQSGRRTVLVERKAVGGTCVNYGCTPTKTLYASARAAHLARRAADFGIDTGQVGIDMPAVKKRMADIVEDFRSGTENSLRRVDHLTLLYGHARFTDKHTIRVDDQEFSAPLIFINTGARPLIPNIPGLAEAPYVDNGSLLQLDEVPKHLVILGGGYIGLEFAQMYRRLGAEVTVLERGGRLMEREDTDVSDAVIELLREEGIDVRLNAAVERVEKLTVHLKGGDAVTGSHLLVAVGRKPNTDDLGLDRAGVELDDKGHVRVDDQLQTTIPGVHALGDVKGGPAFTHASYDDFRILEANLLHGGTRTTKNRTMPYVVFLDPQLGRIGPSEAELTRQGRYFICAKIPASQVARPIEMGETRGFIKAAVDATTGEILSATTFCVEGGELLACLQIAMMAKMHYQELRNGIFSHPTLAEGLNNLFMTLD